MLVVYDDGWSVHLKFSLNAVDTPSIKENKNQVNMLIVHDDGWSVH
jgi:hypothetical protein